MALKVDCSIAAEESVSPPDVALAWKSLHKAKEAVSEVRSNLTVKQKHCCYMKSCLEDGRHLHTTPPNFNKLQRIANKFDHEDWNCAKAQKTRKKQGCERSFDSCRGQEEIASNEIKTGGSGLSCRETCGRVSPASPKNHSLECHDTRNGLARLMHLPFSRELTSARMEAHSGRAAPHICSASDGLEDSFSDQVEAGKKSPTEQREGALCSTGHPPSFSEDSKQFSAAPCGLWRHTSMVPSVPPAMSSLSPYHSPIAQKLEGLRKRLPDNKLERLKERIREQKQRHQLLTQEAKQPNSSSAEELLPPQPLKRKVRKVAFAPPAPVYRGFSAVTLTAAHSPAAEESGSSETDELAATSGSGGCKNKSPDQRERHMTSRSQKHKQEQSSSKSPVPKKALKEKGYNLIGASAWRDGQKLAKKLLGPPPKFPKPGSTYEEQIPKSDSEPSKEFQATPPKEESSRENDASGEDEHMRNSPSHKSHQTTGGHSTELASNALTRDAKQILRDLHLQNQSCEESRSTNPQEDTCTGKLYPENNPSSTEISGMAVSDCTRHNTRSSLMKAGIEPRNYSRGKSAILLRSKGPNSPGQKASEKESVTQSAKMRIHLRKAHSYNPEAVHEFMHRKVEERKKKNLEEKKSSKQAIETRAKRLQEVYKKQKEVLAKKSCSENAKISNRGGVPVAEGSQYKLAQEQTVNRSLERNFMEWVHKTSCALLRSVKQGNSDLHPETTQSAKATDTSGFPSSLASESEFLSPLKLKDLAVCPSPAPYLPPQSFFLPLKMAKSGLKGSASEDTSSPSPHRNAQDRVKAIHSLAMELGERIERAMERLRGTSRLQNSDGNGGGERRPFGLEPPSCPSPRSKTKTSKSEQNRTTDVQTLLSAPSPHGFWISLAHMQDRLETTPCMGSPEEAEAQKRKERIQGLLSDTAAVSEESLGSFNSAVAGRALEDVWRDFMVNKESDGEPCLLQEDLITSIPSPSFGIFTRSPEREPANQRNRCVFDTLSEVQKQVEIVPPSPRGNLRSSRNHGFESCTSPARRIGMQKEFEDSFGRGPRCIDPEERYRHLLDNIQQTSLMLDHKLKAHQLQQEEQLAVLREKAKLEAQESQRSLDGLLKHQLAGLCNSQTSCTVRARPKPAKQEPGEYPCEGDPGKDDTAEDRFRVQSTQQPALKTEINCNAVAAVKATERKSAGEVNLDSTSHQQGSLSAKHGDTLHIHQVLNPLPPLVNQADSEKFTADDSGDNSEQVDSTSQWSEVSQFYGGSSTFCHFSLTMAEQYLREEELRSRHQTALLRLREKALQEKTKAELAWLEHRKCCRDNLQDSKEASAIAEKQQRILTKLKQEQAEIQHLRNIYRAAHQERKLLLKQHREILLMQQSTAQLQRELRGLAGRPQFTNSPEDIEETIKQKKTGTISSPATSSVPTEATANRERPALSRDGNSCAQLENTESRKYQSLPTEKGKTLLQCRQQAEAPKRWKQWVGTQDPEETETVAKEPCDSTDQMTHSPIVDEDSENTEINDRCHVLLHLEHPHSAKMDTATLPTEDKPHEFLETNQKEKKLVLNQALAPKDNEDIHSHDSNATLSSVEELVSDTPPVEKVYRVPIGSQETEGQDEGLCSLNTANDGDRRSGLIPEGPSIVEAQTRKGRWSEEQRRNVDSERESDTTYVGIKKLQRSKILPRQDVPLHKEEVKVFALFEKNSAEHNPLVKHLDSDACDPSDEEPALKTCSEGLASTVSSTKSHDSFLSWESVNSCHSLPEFHKVSAIQINLSENSVSDSDLEVEDTGISVPEESVVQQQPCDGDDVTKTPIAVSDGNELLSSEIGDEQVPCDDCSHEASSLFHGSEKRHGDVSEYECAYESHSVISSNSEMPNLSASGREDPFSFLFDNTADERGQPYLEASALLTSSQICNVNRIPSQEKSGQDSDPSSRSLLYDGEFCTKENAEQMASASVSSKGGKNGESFHLSISQRKAEFMCFPAKSFLRNLDAVTEQFNNSILLLPEKSITDVQTPLFPIDSSLNSRHLPSFKEAKINHTELLTEGHVSNKPNEILSSHLLRPESPEEAPTEAEISLFNTQTFYRVAAQDQNNSAKQSLTYRESEMIPLSSISSKKQLPHAKSCPSENDDDIVYISDEVLPPIDKETLSEILSPVDEVLSYGSADLPSSQKKDFSIYSEDLPTPPDDAGGVKSDDVSFNTEDFPSPPEQMTFSEMKESHHSLNEDAVGQTDELSSLSDSTVPEELPPPSPELMDVFSAQDANVSELFRGKEIISEVKEDLLEHVTTENQTKLQRLGLPCVSSPISSGQAVKRPEQLKKQCKPILTLSKAQEDNEDPLSSFEVGDRVLVKHIQPGTLMFKGCTCFNEGYWAGVALDKPEGEHDGTYGGVKYFVCANFCGVFVRPDQISHLLEDNEKSSGYSGDEDSFCDDGTSRRDCKCAEDNQHGTGYREQKPEDTYSARGSALKENKSRSCMSQPSGKVHKRQFPIDDQYTSNEITYQTSLVHLESDKETELIQVKQETVAEDILSVKNKDSHTEEVNKSKPISCLLKDQKRNKLADDISRELTKKLLYDTLMAFSDATEHKYKSAIEKELQNHGKGLNKEGNHSTNLSKQSGEFFDVLLYGCDALSIPGPHTAQTVSKKIVTKFVDDAVKEYKKIKRKQGAKADTAFQGSSETPQGSLPFLIEILDAGVFGSSEDFDQLNSIQHAKEIKTQKQTQYSLDYWHSAPWKKTTEVPLVVPHNSSHVKVLSAHAVDELWTPQNSRSSSRRNNVPKHFECNDISDDSLEAESKRIYNKVIFDLTHELLHAEYQVTAKPNTLPWLRENLGSRCSRRTCRKTDVSEVKGEVIKIMNLEENSLEKKRKLLNMTKYGNCKRDRVDLILIQELHKEESQWIDYAEDELAVKMRVTEDIFDSLVLDTIEVLKKIFLKRTRD